MDEAVAVVGAAAAAEVDDGGGVDDNLGLFVKILLLVEFIYFNSWNLKLEYLDRFWFFRIKNY